MKRRTPSPALLWSFLIAIAHLHAGDHQAEPTAPDTLTPIFTHKIEVPEPSGLALSADGQFLWTVSDKNGTIYQLNTHGHVIKTLPPLKGKVDLEGITITSDTSHLWVVAERKREIIQIDYSGNEHFRKRIQVVDTSTSGLEGIAWDSKETAFYIINEKKPALLLKLSPTFTIAKEYALTGAADFSGICYDAFRDKFWIVSDQSRLLLLWSPESGVEKTFALDYKKAEGIAVDTRARRIFIVSDSKERLYIYDIPE